MIAGGGTGGHIYPAIAIGRSLQKRKSDLEVRFVGTSLGLEQKIMAREKLSLDLIQSGKLNFSGRWLQKINALVKIPIGVFQSFQLILKHKPDFVLGVGGYASAPFLLAAVLLGKNTAIWEPNAHPGMANRWISKWVSKAYLVFEEAKKYLGTKNFVVCGMPLREEIETAREKNLNKSKSESHQKFTILCFGGSQGSLFLNTKISEYILRHPELHHELRVVHQTGSLGYQEMLKKYEGVSCVELHEFIYNMPDFLSAADVQFCRGGASTIAEAASFGIVPIIVPLPAADDHQQRNAEAVVAHKAGYMIIQSEFDDQKFDEVMNQLRTDRASRDMMSANIKKMAPVRAADRIADDILNSIS